MNQQVSNLGEQFVKTSEGLRLVIYPDSENKDTIGWGHLIKLSADQWIIDQNKVITLEQAEELYREDIFEVEVYLNNVIFINWRPQPTQYQFDALADFVFQYGTDLANRYSHTYDTFRSSRNSAIVFALQHWFNDSDPLNHDSLLVGRRQREILLFRDGKYT